MQQAVSLRAMMATDDGEPLFSHVMCSCVSCIEYCLTVLEGIQKERHLQEEVC